MPLLLLLLLPNSSFAPPPPPPASTVPPRCCCCGCLAASVSVTPTPSGAVASTTSAAHACTLECGEAAPLLPPPPSLLPPPPPLPPPPFSSSRSRVLQPSWRLRVESMRATTAGETSVGPSVATASSKLADGSESRSQFKATTTSITAGMRTSNGAAVTEAMANAASCSNGDPGRFKLLSDAASFLAKYASRNMPRSSTLKSTKLPHFIPCPNKYAPASTIANGWPPNPCATLLDTCFNAWRSFDSKRSHLARRPARLVPTTPRAPRRSSSIPSSLDSAPSSSGLPIATRCHTSGSMSQEVIIMWPATFRGSSSKMYDSLKIAIVLLLLPARELAPPVVSLPPPAPSASPSKQSSQFVPRRAKLANNAFAI